METLLELYPYREGLLARINKVHQLKDSPKFDILPLKLQSLISTQLEITQQLLESVELSISILEGEKEP